MRFTQPVLGRRVLGAAAAASLSGAARAQGVSGKVTVVTSFSNDVTAPFKRAFEAAHPGTTLEVQSRNTTAGVRFVQDVLVRTSVVRCPQRGSNPCYRLERAASWTTRR